MPLGKNESCFGGEDAGSVSQRFRTVQAAGAEEAIALARSRAEISLPFGAGLRQRSLRRDGPVSSGACVCVPGPCSGNQTRALSVMDWN